MSEPKRQKKKEYWSKEQEDAVALYLSLRPDSAEANKVFEDFIYEPLKKLVENILFTYKLNVPDMDVEEQVLDTMSFVISKFDKFDPTKGHKSFSYYGTVAKNYMIAQRSKSYQTKIKMIDIDDILGFELTHNLSVNNEFDNEFESHTFLFKVLADELETTITNEMCIDKNVYKLSEAIIYLLRNYQYIQVHNKRQFYIIAREFTGLSAKEITKALIKIKEIFTKTHKSLR